MGGGGGVFEFRKIEVEKRKKNEEVTWEEINWFCQHKVIVEQIVFLLQVHPQSKNVVPVLLVEKRKHFLEIKIINLSNMKLLQLPRKNVYLLVEILSNLQVLKRIREVVQRLIEHIRNTKVREPRRKREDGEII